MIEVKIIADSICDTRVTTFELSYPRYIHSELMTHRVFSRNAASSRAIPIEKVIQLVKDQTVMPMWTANEKGMQGKILTEGTHIHKLNGIWLSAAASAIHHAETLSALGAHKQNVNRLLEPFQHIKVVVTATDFWGFFNLRDHPDAQPEIRALAREMYVEFMKSQPDQLHEGDWHLPYALEAFMKDELTLEQAKMVSASCCAQVSYRLNDDSVDKAEAVYARLVSGRPLHASPFEHQCTPGEGRGNLNGWKQLRQEIEDAMA